MSRIRARDTGPELLVRVMLRSAGVRFRSHPSNLPGRPDFCVDSSRITIFVHGCFWHRHQECRLAYSPKTRAGFWRTKFAENVRRDRRNARALRRLGWTVLTVWECRLRDPGRVQRRLERLLRKKGHSDTLSRSVNRGPSGLQRAAECPRSEVKPSPYRRAPRTSSNPSVGSGTRSRPRSRT